MDGDPRSLVRRLLERHCKREGFRLETADARGHAGYVEMPTGRRSYFKGTRFDLNTQGASEVANDKAFAAQFLKDSGLTVPQGCFVLGSEIRNRETLPDCVLAFAGDTGFPLYVKPNLGRLGDDVMRVDSHRTLQDAVCSLSERHDQIIVQEAVSGRDIRVIILDGKVLCAIERHPPQVTGDGVSSLAELVEAATTVNAADERVDLELIRQGLVPESVPDPGKTVALLPVSNLSSGGSAEIITDALSEEDQILARRAAETLSLRYAGVDLIIPFEPRANTAAVILEVNAAPGLSHLYRQGAAEARVVEQIYGEVFSALFA